MREINWVVFLKTGNWTTSIGVGCSVSMGINGYCVKVLAATVLGG